MSVNLSIKNVPTGLVRKLKQRATRNRRSFRDELMTILEESVAAEGYLSPHDILRETRRLKIRTKSESVGMVRVDRDAR